MSNKEIYKNLITIFITNYNYGKFIEQSINSVLQQTIQDFELIIIDDGSEDDSLEIYKRYENNDKIKFLSNISTITTDLKKDLKKFIKKKFLKKYGHLRPGTYDITSDNYSDGYNKYFSNKKNLNDKNTKVKNSNWINRTKIQHNKSGN